MIQAVAFDFDGVLVESVDVKTRAFAALFEPRGPDVVDQVVRYHLEHGGVSRVEKFRYFYEHILREPLPADTLRDLGERFSAIVFEAVVSAPMVPGALAALDDCRARGWRVFIVSGTPQDELTEIVERRGLSSRFDGIFGSPRRKGELLTAILKAGGWAGREMVFVGDAITDYDGAREAGTEYVARRSETAADWTALGVTVFDDLTPLPAFLDQLSRRAG